MNALLVFVVFYLVISVLVGLYASRRIKTSTDFILAGRSLPLYITIATVFATWFGSEAVLGIPATFIESGLGGIVSDPFGAGFCLIFVGIFFAARLYRMKLTTIGDFYRIRYNQTIEFLVSIFICISYLGWVSAQIVALGLVIDIVTGGILTFEVSMVIGLAIVLSYTVFGGMASVAIMDFIQMGVILTGLVIVAFIVSGKVDGGATYIVSTASEAGKFDFWPEEMSTGAWLTFIAAFITMGLGSIPQQDVFQRVMSSKDEKVAVRGSIIGGSLYLIFCFVPVFIAFGASIIDPDLFTRHMGEDGDYQRILPEFILGHVPPAIQILFFGALISAIMSTAAGTLLAPSALFVENIIQPYLKLDEKNFLRSLRVAVLCFGLIVFVYAYLSADAGLTIFEMVKNAYLVTLCGAFTPLVFGVYWKKANITGALTSIILGVGSWILLELFASNFADDIGFVFPAQLGGLLMAIVGMVGGSLASQKTEKSL